MSRGSRSSADPVEPGVVVVDKPAGITSHDVVARVRRLAGTRKVGHAGTLDPMATGVLVLGVGRATRLLGHLMLTEKAYDATIRLGISTSTDDAEGEVVGTVPVQDLDEAAVRAAAGALVGDLMQVPTAVSAIKVDGKRAYQRVREGEEVELAARPVTVHELTVQDVRTDGATLDLDVSVRCSSGTYVRALARDLGAALGVGGHLTSLRRIRIGPFDVADAVSLENLDVASRLIAPADAAARLFPRLDLTDEQAIDLGHGKRIEVNDDQQASGRTGPVAAIAAGHRLVGLVEYRGSQARTLVNFPADADA